MESDILEALNVSRETFDRLDSYVHLLLKWQKSINLIAPSTVSEIWKRHILDCAQITALFQDEERWADLGSGAGLPGMIVAIIRSARQPNFEMKLIESNAKKCAFLREAARITHAPCEIIPNRIEDVVEGVLQNTKVLTSRALAPLSALLSLSAPAFKRGAKAVFMKGAELEIELTAASKSWNIDLELIPSLTNPAAQLVVIHSANQTAC